MSTKKGAPLSFEGANKMRVSKGQAVLYIFNELKENGYIFKQDIINTLDINELTFWRYIQEIRSFLYNFYIPYEIKFIKSEDKYVILAV